MSAGDVRRGVSDPTPRDVGEHHHSDHTGCLTSGLLTLLVLAAILGIDAYGHLAWGWSLIVQ